MATSLTVRNVDSDIVQALKIAAAKNGRSAEAEHREILRAALTRPRRRPLGEVLAQIPRVGREEDFARSDG